MNEMLPTPPAKLAKSSSLKCIEGDSMQVKVFEDDAHVDLHSARGLAVHAEPRLAGEEQVFEL